MRLIALLLAFAAFPAAAQTVANPPLLEFGSCQGQGLGCRASATPEWTPGNQACAVRGAITYVVRCDLADQYFAPGDFPRPVQPIRALLKRRVTVTRP